MTICWVKFSDECRNNGFAIVEPNIASGGAGNLFQWIYNRPENTENKFLTAPPARAGKDIDEIGLRAPVL